MKATEYSSWSLEHSSRRQLNIPADLWSTAPEYLSCWLRWYIKHCKQLLFTIFLALQATLAFRKRSVLRSEASHRWARSCKAMPNNYWVLWRFSQHLSALHSIFECSEGSDSDIHSQHLSALHSIFECSSSDILTSDAWQAKLAKHLQMQMHGKCRCMAIIFLMSVLHLCSEITAST